MRRAPLLALMFTLIAVSACAQPVADGAPNRPDVRPAFPEQTEAPEQLTRPAPQLSTVAHGLSTPWGITVLPGDAGYLVTERGGDLHHVSRDGRISPPISGVPEVRAAGQGGLLDVALDLNFAETRVLYLTFAKPTGFQRSATAAVRAELSADHTRLINVREIFEQTPSAMSRGHYGSRVVPFVDGTVFITTGDRRNVEAAQDPSTSYGSVVRVNPDGSIPANNPTFATPGALPELFSYGHRNVQGAAIHPDTGALWTIEHGPAGGDELNLVVPGGNYGWPLATYGENYRGTQINGGRTAHAPDFRPPVYYWDPVIAPGGMVFYDGEMFPEWRGDILAAGLVAAAVVRLDLEGEVVRGEERLADGIGRVRDIAIDHDGAVLFILDAGDRSDIMRLSR